MVDRTRVFEAPPDKTCGEHTTHRLYYNAGIELMATKHVHIKDPKLSLIELCASPVLSSGKDGTDVDTTPNRGKHHSHHKDEHEKMTRTVALNETMGFHIEVELCRVRNMDTYSEGNRTHFSFGGKEHTTTVDKHADGGHHT